MWQNNVRFPSQNSEPNSVLLPDGLTYQQKILSTIPGIYALYPLNETGVTTTALEIINGYNATLFGPTLAAIAGPGSSMGNAAFYDGAVDYAQLPAASLDGPFDPNLGTMLIWAKMANATVWTDGTFGYFAAIGADALNRIAIYKSNINNTLTFFLRANGTITSHSVITSTTEWFCVAITWNKVANRIRAYLNGVQQGADLPYTGVWSGALTDANTRIGVRITEYLHGYPSFLTLANQEATPAQIAAASVAA